jgi:GGDEF domain-containing protein
MVNHFVEKFNNYAAYQVSLSYKDDSNYHLEKQKLLDELYQLDKEINNLNYLHDRIQELVSSGGVDMLQDAFTGLYTDHEIISDFNHRHKHNQIFYMLVIAIDGVTEVKHNFGDQIEEAIARHFVKIVKPLIPDSLRLYRWMADDIYIMMSASQEELEKIENDIKAVFISKQLLHKPTATNLNETLKIKSSITKALKYFKQSIKQAKQQLKF